MKKVLTGIFLITLTASFYSVHKNLSLKKRPIATTVNTTLNGIDMNTAITMINNFEAGYVFDKGPKSICAWYNTQQLKDMMILLNDEIKSVKTDGVRFYLATNYPAVAPNTQLLHVKILLVPTIPKAKTAGHTSTHGDYYEHTLRDGLGYSNGFLTAETGIAVDNDVLTDEKQGALLYLNNTNAICNNASPHFLAGDLAYKWVQARNEKNTNTQSAYPRDDSEYNTVSDWYNICFISSLFNGIINNPDKYDGLRIYLGKGPTIKGVVRDVIVLVPTTKGVNNDIHNDSYNCLEDLDPNFCQTRSDQANYDSTSFFFRLFHSNKAIAEKEGRQFATPENGAAYDIGELCPYNCN